MIIIGAGLAGLLAANMLARRKPQVIEAQAVLPNNHSAVLRFRSSLIGDTLGIPFKKVQLLKAPVPWLNPVADALAYSFKNTGARRSDRSISSGVIQSDRFIAPPDLIQRMAEGLDLHFGVPALPPAEDHQYGLDKWRGPFISTMPMPALMKLLNYPNPPLFGWGPAVNIRATIANCDAYISLMVPDPQWIFSRISVTGNELIIECPGQAEPEKLDIGFIAGQAGRMLGLAAGDLSDIEWHTSKYAKILPIPEHERRTFLHWATTEHNVYSLGRFSTWRPGLLLDDLVQDIRLIDGWLSDGNHYSAARAR